MMSLLRTPLARAVLASMAAGYLKFALRTTRWTLHGPEHYQPFLAGTPVICAFWHEFLPALPAIVRLSRRLPSRRPTQLHALVSQSRDGRFIGDVVRRFGILPIHGSSSRGGAAGLRSLLAALRKGQQIGITPDGPRGPRRQAAPGVAQLAALANVPVLPCAVMATPGLALKTWDRMRVPLPFSRGVVVFGPAIHVPRQDWKDWVPAIAEALDSVARQANRLCAR